MHAVTETQRSKLEVAAYALVLILVQTAITAWLYRANLQNGFSYVLSDVYDNSIEIAILEHWHNVLHGLAHWSTTNYFYPYSGTLGYNDGYFLYGIAYSLFRDTGADPYLANVFVNMVMKTFAFSSFFVFARGVLRFGVWHAVVGAALFEIANNITVHTLHAQLLPVAFAPLCATFLYWGVRAFLVDDAVRTMRFGVAFAVLYGMWAITSYYMLWFFTFFTSLVALRAGFTHRRELRARLAQTSRKTWSAVAGCVLIVALALAPFLYVYLPKAKETGMHSFEDAAAYALSPFDAFNIGTTNYMYGKLVAALHTAIGFPIDFTENQIGLPPGLWLAFAAGCVLILRRGRQQPSSIFGPMVFATVLSLALAIKVGDHTGWRLVYEIYPGAKAVRVISRILIFLTLPVISIAMVAISSLGRRGTWVWPTLICIFLIAEELNMTGGVTIDRRSEMQRLASVGRPPVSCAAFYVDDHRPLTASQGDVDLIYRHNVDAMLIAEYIHLPTINGFSSFNPPEWSFEHPERADYRERVKHYREKLGVHGLCSLDLQTMSWSRDTN